MEHFNGPHTKFLRDSLYKHPVVCSIDVKVEKNINKLDNEFDLDINLLLGK